MIELSHIEKELSKGTEAFKDGRLPEAISTFEQVLNSDPRNISAQEGLFSSLRLVETDRFLANRFSECMGFSPDYYLGFSPISDAPTTAASSRRLNELARNLTPDDGFPFHMGVVLDADSIAQGGEPNQDGWSASGDETPRLRDTVDGNLIYGQTLFSSGRYAEAIAPLAKAIRASPNSLAYLQMAFALWRTGSDYDMTLMNFSFAHIFPTDHWGGSSSYGGRLKSMGRYGKFKMYYYIAPPVRQFYAIPEDVDSRLGFDGYWANTTGTGVELYAPRISYPFRTWLKSILPKQVVQTLQWFVSLKFLTSVFSGRVKLDSMALSTNNIDDLLNDIHHY